MAAETKNSRKVGIGLTPDKLTCFQEKIRLNLGIGWINSGHIPVSNFRPVPV
jgi:hypothetical protein